MPDPVLLWTQRSSFRPCIPCRPACRRSMCIGTAPPCLPCLPPVSCLHRHSASGVALLLYKAIFPSSFFNLNQQIRHPAHFIPAAGIAPAHRHSHPAALPPPCRRCRWFYGRHSRPAAGLAYILPPCRQYSPGTGFRVSSIRRARGRYGPDRSAAGVLRIACRR